MNEWDQLDDIFRDKLQHHDEPAPMHIWDRVEQTRLAQKRRGFGLLKWFSAVTLLLVVGTASAAWVYYALVQDTEQEAANATASLDMEVTSATSNTLSEKIDAEAYTPNSIATPEKISEKRATVSYEESNVGTVFVPPTTYNTITSEGSPADKQSVAIANNQKESSESVSENGKIANANVEDPTIKPGLVLTNPSASEDLENQERDWQFLTAIAKLDESYDPD